MSGSEGEHAVAGQFRAAMRRLAASVHVATVRDGDSVHGMTITAACSLSMDPPAMILCIHRDARAYAAMAASRRLCLNLLGAGEEALAARFAGGSGEVGVARFDPEVWLLDAPAGPVFRGALASLDLGVESLQSFGTHDILACAVDAIRLGAERPALLYANQRYGALAS